MSGLTDAGIIVASCAEVLFSSYRQEKKCSKFAINATRRQKETVNCVKTQTSMLLKIITTQHKFTADIFCVFKKVFNTFSGM